MFGVGTPEIIGIVFIALLIYGPDRLPAMIKKVAGFFRQIKQMSDEVTNTVSKEIHRIEQSTEIQGAKHLIEQGSNLLENTEKEIHQSLIDPLTPGIKNKDEHK